MDKDGGYAAVREMFKAGNDKGSVHIVPDAGHHVYLDNPSETNRIVNEAIMAIDKAG